ncbi:aspartate kinase [Haliangium sp.]|uniref:aspartate kinase n=1 Tax=Haliangium sp. TaxID=2663208 RepID=UPI003D111527
MQKFGGTSVASVEHIGRVAKRIIEAHDDGYGVAVVVSAMSGETDRLLTLARQTTLNPTPSELDALAATGEQVTAALLAMSIVAQGRPARSFLGHQVRITTDSTHGDARIREIDRDRIMTTLANGEIAVLAGFQGIDDHGRITTLGRGGSDTTAVAVAAALGAEACEIYTDVDGVYTADPGICAGARRLQRVSYRQMLALSSLGAQVLHHRSVALAMKYGTPVHVRTSFSSAPGTWVMEDSEDEAEGSVLGIAQDSNLACVRLIEHGGHDETAAILAALARHRIMIERATPSAIGRAHDCAGVTLVLRKADFDRAMIVIKAHKRIETEIEVDFDICKISVVLSRAVGNQRILSRIMKTLAACGAPLRSLSRTGVSISCLVDASAATAATCALHRSLGLSGADDDGGHPTPRAPTDC